MFRQLLTFTLLVVGTLVAPGVVDAHFLFIRIGPHAEAGRGVEVFFSEQARAGDPRFVEKVAHTELWLQDEPGKFTPLKVTQGTDRLRAYLPSGKSVAVVGSCEYGVLKRDKSFLLRYYPKAISGQPAELAKLKRHESTPLEIMATVEGDAVQLVVLREGKPLGGTTLTTVDDDLVNTELKTDEQGRAKWQPGKAGQYAVYVKHVTPTSGSKDGKSYEEIREFATLALDWPLGATEPQPEAVKMFQQAIAARAMWQDFAGFQAKVTGHVDGRAFSGTAAIDAKAEVKLELDDDTVRDWVHDQLHSLVIHRQASSGIRAEPVLRFADDDTKHPLGRLLTFIGGRFASSYRVRGDEIMVVNRNIGAQNMSITVLDNDRNAEGKYLPRSYTVQYWDAATGALNRTETFQNRWQRVGKLDLPASLTQTVSSAAGLSVRHLSLEIEK
jgi:hypothetical protein